MDKLGEKINYTFETDFEDFCSKLEDYFDNDIRVKFYEAFDNEIDLFRVWKEVRTQMQYGSR